jgi:catechol 2,3-dioxygenase-like lactoylglutathione lyase family enzyme
MINGDTLLGLIRTSTMLAVGDLVASTTFYRDVFGFQVVEQAHGPTLTRRDHVDT